MATKYAEIRGIQWLREGVTGQGDALALISFEMPAYTAAADNGQLGGGGFDRGVATTDTLVQMLQKQRRDGKTVALKAAITCERGRQGATNFYAESLAVATSNMTFNVTDGAASEIDAASGVRDRPIQIAVWVTLS